MIEADIVRAAETWRRDGWVLLPGLVPEDEIDRALEDLWTLYPRPEVFQRGDSGGLAEERLVNHDLWEPYRSSPVPTEPAMRPEQFLGMRPFPFPGTGQLNRLVVHPQLVDFASTALGSTDVRLYQLGLWAKYTGLADYEQPMHTDANHSLVPVRMDAGWWHLEGFLYLSDVHDGLAPTRLVRLSESVGVPVGHSPGPEQEAMLRAREEPAVGPRGSYLAYRPDVWHRAVNLTEPGGARFVMSVSFKLAGHDWVGHDALQSRSTSPAFCKFVAGSTPRELELFGVPAPGHPYWNESTVQAMSMRYPGIDTDPWRSALPTKGEVDP